MSKGELKKLRPLFYDIDKELPTWKGQLDDTTGHAKLYIHEVYHLKDLHEKEGSKFEWKAVAQGRAWLVVAIKRSAIYLAETRKSLDRTKKDEIRE